MNHIVYVLAAGLSSVIIVVTFIVILFVLPRPLPGIPDTAPRAKSATYEKNYWVGTPQAFGEIRDGQVQGDFVQFYPNGSLFRVLNYSYGRLNGEALEYHELPTTGFSRRQPHEVPADRTGPVKAVWYYTDGVRNGPYRIYALNGETTEEGEYQNGKILWKRRLSSSSSSSPSSFTR